MSKAGTWHNLWAPQTLSDRTVSPTGLLSCCSHHFLTDIPIIRASLVAQRFKCLPAMRETWVWSLGREDSLEKEMTTHSYILAWRIPWMEEPGGLQSMGSQRVRHNWATSFSLLAFREKIQAREKNESSYLVNNCVTLLKSHSLLGWNANNSLF